MINNKSVIVFGATGFIGSHVAQQFALANWHVICPVRVNSNTAFLRSIDVQIIEADFVNEASLNDVFFAGAVVINCIAQTHLHVAYAERLVVEVTLASKLFLLADSARCECFIQLSTVMVLGFSKTARELNEQSPYQADYDYNQAAIEREQALLNLSKEHAMRLLILRPSNVLGARDESFLPPFLATHRLGFFTVISGGSYMFSCIDARDVGRAMVHLALLPSSDVVSAGIYHVKGEDTSWLDLKPKLDELLNRKSRLLSLSYWLMYYSAKLCEQVYPYGSNIPMTQFAINVMSTYSVLDDSKIRQTGFANQYTIKDALKDAIEADNKL